MTENDDLVRVIGDCEDCGAMDVRVTSRPLYQSAPLSLCDECLETWDNYEGTGDG